MEIGQIRQRLADLPAEIEAAEIAYTEAKFAMKYNEDIKGHLLANIKNTFKGTNAFQETNALASKNYEIHLNLIRVQREKAGKCGAKFHKLQNELDAMRSLHKNIN